VYEDLLFESEYCSNEGRGLHQLAPDPDKKVMESGTRVKQHARHLMEKHLL
jgi:hypothetical protein